MKVALPTKIRMANIGVPPMLIHKLRNMLEVEDFGGSVQMNALLSVKHKHQFQQQLHESSPRVHQRGCKKAEHDAAGVKSIRLLHQRGSRQEQARAQLCEDAGTSFISLLDAR